MLTISKPLSSSQAQTYHAKEFMSAEQNYWKQGDTILGEWQGRMAERYGLAGAIDELHFARLSEGQNPLTGERAKFAVERAADMIKNHQPARALRVLGRALKALPTGNDSVTALYHVSEALLEQAENTNAPGPKQRACAILGSLRNARGSTYYQSINYLFGQYCQ